MKSYFVHELSYVVLKGDDRYFLPFFYVYFEIITATLRNHVSQHERVAEYLLLYLFGDLEQWLESDE